MKQGYRKLEGNTYHHKDLIKENGGYWCPQSKCWWVPLERYIFLKDQLKTYYQADEDDDENEGYRPLNFDR